MHHDRFRAALATMRRHLSLDSITSADISHIVKHLDELSAVMHRPGSTPEEKQAALLAFGSLFS